MALRSIIRRCKICNRIITFEGHNIDSKVSRISHNRGLCHECAYWVNFINIKHKNLEIMDHVCYTVFPKVTNVSNNMILGGNGRLRYFVRNDHTIGETNDVWTIGEIPERFRDQLPNTAAWITENVYRRLLNNNQWCFSRGCMDRYRCYHYNRALELNGEAFNKVPGTWRTGGEHCQAFLDFDQTPGLVPLKIPTHNDNPKKLKKNEQKETGRDEKVPGNAD